MKFKSSVATVAPRHVSCVSKHVVSGNAVFCCAVFRILKHFRSLHNYCCYVAFDSNTRAPPPSQPPIFLIKRSEIRRHEVRKYEYETTWTGGCDLLQHCAVEDLFSACSCGAEGRDTFAVPVLVIMYHNDN